MGTAEERSLSVRLPEPLAQRVAAELERRRQARGPRWTTSDVVRVALERYLDEQEAR